MYSIRGSTESPRPAVPRVAQARAVLERMASEPAVVARVQYGCGLRLTEAPTPRVGGIDVERRGMGVRSRSERRHGLRAQPILRHPVRAVRGAGIHLPASVPTPRHSFARTGTGRRP